MSPQRKRFERLIDLTGFEIGTFNPSGVEPPANQIRAAFNIGQEDPARESEDWTIYALPQLAREWWPTVDAAQAYAIARSPFSLELDTGVTPEKMRVDIPFQGIAWHVCASELRVGLRVDPCRFNVEAPPLSLDGRSIAVWARRGRPSESVVPLTSGFNSSALGDPNQVPTPPFAVQLLNGSIDAQAYDRNGILVWFSGGNPGLGWQAATIGGQPGFFGATPSYAARVIS